MAGRFGNKGGGVRQVEERSAECCRRIGTPKYLNAELESRVWPSNDNQSKHAGTCWAWRIEGLVEETIGVQEVRGSEKPQRC